MVTFLPHKKRKCVLHKNDSTSNWPRYQPRPHKIHLTTLECSASSESQANRIV